MTIAQDRPTQGAPLVPGNLRAVERAIGDLRRGSPVIVRAGTEAAMVLAAEGVLDENLTYLRSISATPPSLAITSRRAKYLGYGVEDTGASAIRVSLAGGVSAADVRNIVNPAIPNRQDLPAPLGLRAITPDGLEAAIVELIKLSALLPAGVLVSIPDQRKAYLDEWALAENVLVIEADDIATFRTREAKALTRVGEAEIPLLEASKAKVIAFRPPDGSIEHLVIVVGDPDPGAPTLVRVHSQCFTGDLLGSLRCDCGDQLRGAIAEINKEDGGLLVYLSQEGRGIGLVNKLRAYELQDEGLDTIEANEQLGFAADERIYQPAAEMLSQLGFDKIRLMTNNPDKLESLAKWGLEIVERVPHSFPSNEHNRRYLDTKQQRAGHLL